MTGEWAGKRTFLACGSNYTWAFVVHHIHVYLFPSKLIAYSEALFVLLFFQFKFQFCDICGIYILGTKNLSVAAIIVAMTLI